jgi:lysophospholipase L1-like esterase
MMTAENKLQSKPLVVACLGSSTTAAKGTFNWIKELESRPQNSTFSFLNFGVGGDLSYNALLRLPVVNAAEPDIVIILIGSNDVLALVSEKVRRFFTFSKRLPQMPSPEWFRENLLLIVQNLKNETAAKIGLISLPPIGEDAPSKNPFQQEINLRCKQYSEIIKEISQSENTGYMPMYERLHEQIVALPGKAFTSFNFLAFYRDYLFREFILGYSFDKIAEMNGWRFHIDGVHLNTRGGMILTNLVQDFLNDADSGKSGINHLIKKSV